MSRTAFTKPDPFDVALYGLILAFGVAAIYFFQLRAMSRQVDETQRQTRLSVRPWVGLDDDEDAVLVTPVHFDKEGNASVLWGVKVRNYSNNGAQHVFPFASLLVTEDIAAINAAQKQMCEMVNRNPDIGYILFPGKFKVAEYSGGHFERSKMVSKNSDGKFQAWLVGCVGYRDQFGVPYHTGFTRRLVKPGDATRSIRIDPVPNSEASGAWVDWGGSIE